MPVIDPALLERATAVRLLVLDVDGVLTDGKLYFDPDGNELKAFNTRDGFGMKMLQRSGVEVAVITARNSAAVTHRMQQLGIRHLFQGCENKLEAFMQLLSTTGLDAEQVCYAGDDWIDLPILIRAGLAVAVANAEPQVKERAHWVTRQRGGDGAVREICNLILTAQGRDRSILDEILT
ncbi:MAG: 3-deoxy-manno-octulosonate-8-phosphatase KdsC [Lysobacterales bacterium]|jgi:3-deoxy-D-manno-octulosonate 8-phosphate phosphatase (KDO 8-P phosphatase)